MSRSVTIMSLQGVLTAEKCGNGGLDGAGARKEIDKLNISMS